MKVQFIYYDDYIWTISFMRLVVSTICGIAIGYERTSRNKEVGLRTHAIVAISSCLMMLISKYGFSDLQNYMYYV